MPPDANRPELMVVMPVFNEQASVGQVVTEWTNEIGRWTPSFVLLAINDGSTDHTLTVLQTLREQLGPRLEILDQPNRGHGQSCLAGYRAAAARAIPYVFQMDSDGQCDPRHFGQFWRERERHDVLYGRRVRRDDGFRRAFASGIVRLFLLLLFRVNCVDANVPYRLMRTAAIAPLLDRVPPDFSLANIALAVLLRKHKRTMRHGSLPIGFRARTGGEPTVALGKFGAKAGELYRQLKGMLAQK